MPASDACAVTSPLRRFGTLAIAAVTALAIGSSAAWAQSREDRLSEALQRARAQVSALEAEAARLRGEVAALEKAKEEEVQAVRDEAAQQVAGVEARFEAAREQFQKRLDEEGEFRNRLLDNIEKWKAAHGEVSDLAQEKEAERQALTEQLANAKQVNAVCVAKNKELFAVGNDILDRFSNIGVADVLRMREPFLGIKRVELQNIAQDYQDELLDNQVTTPE